MEILKWNQKYKKEKKYTTWNMMNLAILFTRIKVVREKERSKFPRLRGNALNLMTKG